jgi:uncharacterized protein involved in exopolysaccharide biosynthesis
MNPRALPWIAALCLIAMPAAAFAQARLGAPVCMRQVSEPEVAAARAELSERMGKYEEVRQALNGVGDAAGLGDLNLDTAGLRQMLRSLAEVRRQIADLAAALSDPDAPHLRALRAQAQSLERIVRTETDRVLSVLEAGIDAAQRRLERLERRREDERRSCGDDSV